MGGVQTRECETKAGWEGAYFFLVYFPIKLSRLPSKDLVFISELPFKEQNICILILDEFCSCP